MKKIIISVSIVALLLVCILFRFMATKHSENEQAQAIQASSIPSVDISTPKELDVSSTIEAPGRVNAVTSSDVIARVQGMILKQHYNDGDYVKKGQLLFTIDPQEFQIAVEKAKANLESAKAAQYQAQKDFERAEELVKNDYVSKSAYDQALAAKNSANAAVRSANAALSDANRLLSYTRVTAPIQGKISKPEVTVGNYLSSPNTKLTTIVSVDPIYVQYSLDSAVYLKLKNDEILPDEKNKKIKVEVKLPDGTMYDKTGNLDFLDNRISETTGSINLRATFPNPDGTLIPGDFVGVKVYSNKTAKYLGVPQAAVLQDTEGRYLYIIDENNVAHKRKIETDGQQGDFWLIKSGIEKDEQFASSGIIKVRDGAKVNIISKTDNEQNLADNSSKE